MTDRQSSRRIKVLRDDVARKIAAGEVIDRPHAVVRELLDNAIDADARNIQVYLESGGIQRIRVIDDGRGMDRADLDLCWLPHATSKIETENDLLSVSSLGFRGEALASIATVSRMEIVSNPGTEAGRVVVHGGKQLSLEQWRGPVGTSVDVAELFYSLPARRRFLKSPSAESAMCRLVLLDRALSYPDIAFRYFTDGTMRMFLPTIADAASDSPAESEADAVHARRRTRLRARVINALPEVVHADFLFAVSGSGDGFRFDLILETPDTFRNDRKYIQSFVNGRRIWEYSFVQALEHAYTGYLPGGRFPVAFLFLQVDPNQVDFNIHPAKREARFRNLPDMHHRIVETVQNFLHHHARRTAALSEGGGVAGSLWPQSLSRQGAPFPTTPSPPHQPAVRGAFATGAGSPPGAGSPQGAGSRDWFAREERARNSPPEPFSLERRLDTGARPNIRYLGQVLGVFLVAETENRLLLVDQHAAHERMLFERFSAHGPVQRLLVPHLLSLEFDRSRLVRQNRSRLADDGIELEPLQETDTEGGTSEWQILAVPEPLSGALDTLVKGLDEVHIGPGDLTRDLYARMACRSALMDGDPIDPVTALTLIEESLKLENPRCPHGRPIWHELSRERLFELVGRLV